MSWGQSSRQRIIWPQMSIVPIEKPCSSLQFWSWDAEMALLLTLLFMFMKSQTILELSMGPGFSNIQIYSFLKPSKWPHKLTAQHSDWQLKSPLSGTGCWWQGAGSRYGSDERKSTGCITSGRGLGWPTSHPEFSKISPISGHLREGAFPVRHLQTAALEQGKLEKQTCP